MERLVTTSQAAQILGLSLQGVHYRIKNKQLKSIKQAGKTYVYISENVDHNISHKIEEIKSDDNNKLLQAKDEQIKLMKKSMKWMKSQYKGEIFRLEKNQKRIINVFNSEIKLLQSAFNEMKNIYKPSLENTQSKYISLVDFTTYMKSKNKDDKEIKLIVLKAIQRKDKRFIYNRSTKKVIILKSDFSDLV